MKRKTGFTLIELLIVIVVISILIGIALPRFKGMRDEGNIVKAKGELRTLQTAVESYFIHNNDTYPSTWPDDIEGATPDIIGPTAPTDPFGSGADYQYSTSGDYYVIYSVGSGQTAGTCSIAATGVVTEGAGDPIYVTNGTPRDESP